MEISIPQWAWFGDKELKLWFPDFWNISVQNMLGQGKRAISRKEISYALRNPLGTKSLSRLAEGKKEAVIIFDDITRPTRVYEIVPCILTELQKAGLKDDHIRFICANGSHGTFDKESFVKKLGENIVENYPVFNHNPYSNLTYVGHTTYGNSIEVNAEVMTCDLKISVGSILPHPQFGYSGGAKIVLPGVAGIKSICYNHGDLGGFSTAQIYRQVHHSCEMAYGRVNQENILRLDAEQAAKMVGLDMTVNVLVDFNRNCTEIFAGDIIKAQREGVKVASKHYHTPIIPEADIIVSNAYSKASEAAIATWPAISLKKDGDLVLVVNSPIGQVIHYVHGRWGTRLYGDLYLPPPNILNEVGRIILYSKHFEKQPWLELVPREKTVVIKNWDEIIEELENRHGRKARVAIYPDATIQKPF